MRVIIAGSRSIKGSLAISLIDQAIEDSGWTIDEVISGDAAGVDTAAVEWARINHVDCVRMPANWPKYPNKAAGFKRNQKMAWYAKVTEEVLTLQNLEVEDKYKGGLIAIWKNGSKGTGHMIDIAKEAGLEVFVLSVT